MNLSRPLGWLVAALVVVALAIAPLVSPAYVTALLLTIFMSVGLVYAWNLLAFTGYLSFGQVTWFGSGAYLTALLIVDAHLPWFVAAPIAAAAVLPFAAVLGTIMLRLRGPFFSIGMLGCAQIMLRVVSMASPITHGGEGVYLPAINSLYPVYCAMGGVAAAMLIFTRAIYSASFGLRLRSIREAEDAAEVLGVPTTRMKVIAFMVASFVPALLGGIDAWYLSFINPSSAFNSAIDLQTVAMGVLGGLGTVWGPLVGGVLLSIVNEVFWAQFPQVHLGLLGLVVALTVLLLRRGVVPVVHDFVAARLRPRTT